MLTERLHVLQHERETPRRLFEDFEFDLFLWENPAGEIVRFQLGYAKATRPRVFEWKNGRLFHFRIDTGDGEAISMPMTPLLRPDMHGDPRAVADRLERAGMRGSTRVLEFVLDKLRQG